MNSNYQLPIDGNWNTQDIVAVSTMVDDVLSLYESGVDRDRFMKDYQAFLAVMPAKGEQKSFDRDLKAQTGHQIYQAVKLVQAAPAGKVRA
ncbi:UPF0223 family protein [Eupransor demetentiae]|uniref:UPF0223 family (YktA) n=1 Tax=Eupransor demetentiae TaxID=3109584 RepID=A0ABM9N4D6_9LACO|nr:UPF0223 family (YktA) [Lactobacillaceae bacterium LMG 33000]